MKIKYNAEVSAIDKLQTIKNLLKEAEVEYYKYTYLHEEEIGKDEARKVYDFCDTIMAHRRALEKEIERLKFLIVVDDYEDYAQLLTLQAKGYRFILAFGRHTNIASDNGEYEYYAIKPEDDFKKSLDGIESSVWEGQAVEASEAYEFDEDDEYDEGDEPWLEYVDTYAEEVTLEKLIDTMTNQYGITKATIW